MDLNYFRIREYQLHYLPSKGRQNNSKLNWSPTTFRSFTPPKFSNFRVDKKINLHIRATAHLTSSRFPLEEFPRFYSAPFRLFFHISSAFSFCLSHCKANISKSSRIAKQRKRITNIQSLQRLMYKFVLLRCIQQT
ncbi:CLUMA_CG008211, isoform A [Clunio marinus]|uniref:CLUMA_CG008211, isoform A n=1 Tax=Clunio marinus TaxID=568069 RepID=A0A1J1I2Y5_9DIPT|nr:CLUMA_CG008211, isoform A [Clunio marinus]